MINRLYLKKEVLDTEINLVNGNFEGNISGWTNTCNATYANGKCYMNFGETGGISQYIDDIIPGAHYNVTLYHKYPYSLIPVTTGSTLTISLGDDSSSFHTPGIKSRGLIGGASKTLTIDKSVRYDGYIEYIKIVQSEVVNIFEEIQLSNDTDIFLTFKKDDVQDISRRSSSFSQTLIIPGTKENNKLFEMLFDINIEDTTQTFNKVNDCVLYQNDLIIFEGSFQIKKVIIDTHTNDISYECIMYSNEKSFADLLSSSYITGNIDEPIKDIDFSEYDQILSKELIVNSFTNDTGEGVVYPCINYFDKQSLRWEVEDFRPAFFIKEIWDKIFSKEGYTYSSTFINSDEFKSLLMPSVNKIVTTDEELLSRKFRAGLLSDQNDCFWSTQYNAFGDTHRAKSNIPWSYINFRDDDNSGLRFFDNNDNYKVFGMRYLVPVKGMYQFTTHINFDVYFTIFYPQTISCYIRDKATGLYPKCNIILKLFRKRNGIFTLIKESKVEALIPTTGIVTEANNYKKFGSVLDYELTTNNETFWEFEAGDEIFPEIYCDLGSEGIRVFNSGGAEITGNSGLTVKAIPVLRKYDQSDPTKAGCYFENQTTQSSTLFEGDMVYCNTGLPTKMKKIDFIKGITNMFNLVGVVDKNNPKNIIFENRDTYYTGGKKHNWTKKVDSVKNIQKIQSFVNKNFKATYLLDDDFTNRDYNKTYNEIYGQQVILNEEKTTEEMVIELPFASTQAQKLPGSNMVVSQIFDYEITDEGKKLEIKQYLPRILYRNYINFSAPYYDKTNGYNVFELGFSGGTFWAGQYMTATHFDNPYLPTKDINFGICKTYYNAFTQIPYDNLYNRFYKKQVEQYIDEDSRQLTALFNLNETDLYDFDLSDTIDIDGQSFIVDNINKYNPTSLTEVTLLKLKDVYIPTTENQKNEYISSLLNWNTGFTKDFPKPLRKNTTLVGIELMAVENRRVVIGSGSTSTYTSTNYKPNNLDVRTRGVVIGGNNSVGNTRVVLVGNNNTSLSSSYDNNTVIFGNDNTLKDNTESVSIMGSGNTVEINVKNTQVLGDNTTVNRSNSTYINSSEIYFKNPATPIIHFIDGGEAQPLTVNRFNPIKQCHFVSGGDASEGVRTLRPSIDNTFVVDSNVAVDYIYKDIYSTQN